MRPRKNSPSPSAKGKSPKTPDSYSDRVKDIIAVLRSIPRGRTVSYGQVAAMTGNLRGARQVARVLHSLSEKQSLPWHRVINREGRISLPMHGPGSVQASLLKAEGVAVDAGGKVAASAAWRPERTGRKTAPAGSPSRRPDRSGS